LNELQKLQNQYDGILEGIPINKTCGENGSRYFKANVDAVRIANPDVVLEFGFNRGSSALAFLLGAPKAIVYTVDTRRTKEVQKALDYFEELFPGRLHYIEANSQKFLTEPELLPLTSVDFTYIDGDHSKSGMEADIRISIRMGAKYILLDEYYNPPHKKDCQALVKEYRLEVVKDYHEGWGERIYSVLTIPPKKA